MAKQVRLASTFVSGIVAFVSLGWLAHAAGAAGWEPLIATIGSLGTFIGLLARGLIENRAHLDDDSGVLGAFPELPMPYVFKEVAEANTVDVLQTWCDNLATLQPAFRAAAHKRNARIRILLTHPNSGMLTYRAVEYRDGSIPGDELRARLIGQISDLKQFCRQHRIESNVEVRLYYGTPVLALYGTDRVAYIGAFWRGGSAMQYPQLKIDRSGYYARAASRHFDLIWNDGTTVRASSL